MILPGRQPHPVDGALGAPHNRRIGYSKQSHRPRERPIGLHLESHPPAYESPKVTVVTVVTVIHSPRNYPVPISTLGHPRWKVEHVWTHHWDKMCVEAPKMYRNATHKLCFLFQDFETRHCHIKHESITTKMGTSEDMTNRQNPKKQTLKLCWCSHLYSQIFPNILMAI